MASAIATIAHAAHNVASSLIADAQIQPGAVIPAQEIKEDAPDKTSALVLTGKNIIIGVPGAFTTPCNAHIPAYIETYEEFKNKGINEIYVVGVNDVFVTNDFSKIFEDDYLSPFKYVAIHFIADDKAAFIGSLGLLFDATPLLGGQRSKRFVIVTEGDKVLSVAVEVAPPDVTITAAKAVLAQL
ncbi:peroxiredoxin [Laccaria bicolor S238N-H82]|uniref:Peroxiredoxin n=1 Tax=Laccaria bicolor (strain S238N-H82 / ATCC MYA-4686) TaxID=486041 RepID=B0E213_LACBS|nr:peroxiredoxin [Laccaria bicolor S238N-H82]EDQ99091.1 peroxiredoxin [Laccaria bicolor S238N-H82]|eukprot:XP_001890224.1 peroxiredoxin [Laccaria bicolor S238N-H82]